MYQASRILGKILSKIKFYWPRTLKSIQSYYAPSIIHNLSNICTHFIKENSVKFGT